MEIAVVGEESERDLARAGARLAAGRLALDSIEVKIVVAFTPAVAANVVDQLEHRAGLLFGQRIGGQLNRRLRRVRLEFVGQPDFSHLRAATSNQPAQQESRTTPVHSHHWLNLQRVPALGFSEGFDPLEMSRPPRVPDA